MLIIPRCCSPRGCRGRWARSPRRSWRWPRSALALLAGGLGDEYLRPDRWSDLIGRRRPRARRAAGRARPLPRARRVDARGDRRWAGRCSIVLAAAARLLAARAAGPASRRWRCCCSSRCTPSRRSCSTSAASSSAARVLALLDDRLPAGRAARRRRRAGRRRRRGRGGDRRAGHRAPRSTAASRGGTTSSGRSTRPAARAVAFSWNHDYSPLNWPRDGRELLRVKARSRRVLEGGATSTSSTA